MATTKRRRKRIQRPNKIFNAEGKRRSRVRASRRNLVALGRRFRSIEAKMKFLRSLRG